ncbi:MAG: DUF1501 domain-containing protein [Planctomycetaceae bacterium]|nr:DUF1501 domain-containing protein [Planctomycetaceae bacterium]
MFVIDDRPPSLCEPLSRRAMLRAGSLAAAGLPLLPAIAGGSTAVSGRPAKACIVLFLMGGPPQHSTWDPKPLAPPEVRGEFGPIATRVPGMHVSELLPLTASHGDKLALIRSVVTGDNAHSSSGYYMLTGVPHIPKQVENANPGAPNDHPTMAAVVQQMRRGRAPLPSVRLPHRIFNTDGSVWPGQDSGWLGGAADPWLFRCEPASAGFEIDQFRLAADVSLGRLTQRRTLLEQIESQLREVDARPASAPYVEQFQQAYDLLSTEKTRSACDLERETSETRDRYGRGQFGQSVLLARRLVEAGVGFVHVNWFRAPDEPMNNPCWDSHVDEAYRLKNVLVPPLDQALSALLGDLEQRGLLETTVVAVLSEFGRSPRINAAAGRDHWGNVFSVALAGGGIRGGQVVGRSDEHAGYPVEGLVAPEDITATIFDRLGLEPHRELQDPAGRPLPLSRGNVLSDLV